jgi:hypothetical protein
MPADRRKKEHAGQKYRQTDGKTVRQTDGQNNSQPYRQIARQRDGQKYNK